MSEAIKTLIEDEFRWFHRHPELSMQEFKTTERLKADLTKAGIRILDFPLKTGVVAEIGEGDKITALRADIDSLPVTEATNLAYQSQTCGVMHACGHDFHAATILGAALFLKDREKELKGRVRVIFQPGEELPGGANEIIRAGALHGVSAIFGIHTIINYPVGTLVIREGATHAAVDRFALTFKGKGTHAAHPDKGIDITVAAGQFLTAVQTIVSRNSDPFATNLVSVTHFEAGNAWNVIPETAFLEGTIRTMTKADRAMVKSRFTALAQNMAVAFGATAEIKWVTELPAMDNDPGLTAFASDLARKEGFTVEKGRPSLGGEDFALYEELVPGAFIQIGSGNSAPNHNPSFVVDPAAIYPAARFMAHLAQAYLERA